MCASRAALFIAPRRIFGLTLVAFVFDGSITQCALSERRDLLRRAFEWRPLRWCGTVDYGMYVCHSPILPFMHHPLISDENSGAQGSVRAVAVLTALVVLTIGIAIGSWLLVEKRILRGKICGLSGRTAQRLLKTSRHRPIESGAPLEIVNQYFGDRNDSAG